MDVRKRIESTLDGIRPALQMDGGDVELVSWDDAAGVVKLRLMGVCSTCPISTSTVKHGIERRLKSMVPEVHQVQAV